MAGRKIGSDTNRSLEQLRKHVPNGWGVEADGHGEPQAAYAYSDPSAEKSDWAEVGVHPAEGWYASVGHGRGPYESKTGLNNAKQAARVAEDLIRKHLQDGGQSEQQRSRMYSDRGGRADDGGMFDNLF